MREKGERQDNRHLYLPPSPSPSPTISISISHHLHLQGAGGTPGISLGAADVLCTTEPFPAAAVRLQHSWGSAPSQPPKQKALLTARCGPNPAANTPETTPLNSSSSEEGSGRQGVAAWLQPDTTWERVKGSTFSLGNTDTFT